MALSLAQCGKDDGTCISSTGKTIIQDRSGLDYHYVEVYDNINLILTQDSVNTGIKVEAGENLIDGITTEIDSGRLVLRNSNTCNWLVRIEFLQFTFAKYVKAIFQRYMTKTISLLFPDFAGLVAISIFRQPTRRRHTPIPNC